MDECPAFVTNRQLYKLLLDTDRKVSAIMAVQDDVNAAAATLVSLANSLSTIAGDLQGAQANIQAEITALQAANPAVDTSALNDAVAGIAAPLAALQAADSAVDALETPAPPAA